MTGQALTQQFSSLSDGLYRVAYYILESGDDAQDAVQDLFIKLWEQKDKLDNILNLKAYCTTMLRNLCIDRIRKEGRINCQEPAEADMVQPGSMEQDLDSREKLEIVMSAINKLPKRQQTVVRKYIFEEMSYEEISNQTGMSNLTLRVLLSNARKSLREVLNENY